VWFTIPPNVRGKLIVTPSTDLGPFGVRAEELILELE